MVGVALVVVDVPKAVVVTERVFVVDKVALGRHGSWLPQWSPAGRAGPGRGDGGGGAGPGDVVVAVDGRLAGAVARVAVDDVAVTVIGGACAASDTGMPATADGVVIGEAVTLAEVDTVHVVDVLALEVAGRGGVGSGGTHGRSSAAGRAGLGRGGE